MKFERNNKNSKGITLITLVVTIIIILILAGITINLIVGKNGIFKMAQKASLEAEKARVIEDIEMAYIDVYTQNLDFSPVTMSKIKEKLIKNYGYTNEQIPMVAMENITDITLSNSNIELQPGMSKEVEVILGDGSGQTYFILIQGKYYPINLTDSKVTLGEGLEELPTGSETIGDVEARIETGEDIIEVEVNKTIITIKAKEDKIGEATITVTYGSIAPKTITVTVKKADEYESLIDAISKIAASGVQKISVNNEDYSMDMLIHTGDMVLDGSTQIKGATLTDKVYEFGNKETDVATETEDAKNTVVLKVEGNLTINEGVTVTACKSENGYGGPKGLFIYCTGTLTNNGTISMTARGAKAEGQNVYLWQNENGSYEYVPAERSRWRGRLSM